MDDSVSAARKGAEAFFAVWNSDGPAVAATRYWHPDIVWEESESFPDAGIHEGREAAVERMAERFEALGRVLIEVVGAEVIGEQVLIEAIVRGRGSASGAPTEMREYFLIAFADGLTIRFREYMDRDRALRAAR